MVFSPCGDGFCPGKIHGRARLAPTPAFLTCCNALPGTREGIFCGGNERNVGNGTLAVPYKHPLTIPRTWDILSIESGATGRRFPQSCYKEEVTAGLRDGRLLLFINDLDDQRDQRDDEHTECEKLGPCNHTDHPLFFRIGGKEDYPRKRGNRLPLLVAPVIE